MKLCFVVLSRLPLLLREWSTVQFAEHDDGQARWGQDYLVTSVQFA